MPLSKPQSGTRYKHYKKQVAGKPAEYIVLDTFLVNGSMRPLDECMLVHTKAGRQILIAKRQYEQFPNNFEEWITKPVYATDVLAHASQVVVYEAQYADPKFGEKALWARPLGMFLETVDGVDRFQIIG